MDWQPFGRIKEFVEMVKNPTLLVIGITLVLNGIVYIVCSLLWR